MQESEPLLALKMKKVAVSQRTPQPIEGGKGDSQLNLQKGTSMLTS